MQNALVLSLLILLSVSCNKENKDYYQKNGKIKNVIFVIGDGMGPQQLSMLQLFAKHSQEEHFKNRVTNLEKLMAAGSLSTVMTNPGKNLVVDSSCSATQYSTGEYSLPEVVGLDHHGEVSKTILELAKEKGLKTGLVSDTRITHATPASFASHNTSRNDENEIAREMLEVGPDIMLSGGLRHFLPQNSTNDTELRGLIPSHISLKSKRKDDINLLEVASNKNYQLAFDKKSLEKTEKGKILGLFENSAMPDGIWHTQNKSKTDRVIPTLKEMASVALKNLEDSENGFFLMIEPGQIDWAGHRNDTGLLLHEMLRADELFGLLHEWMKGREDTLLVVTADHETGGFGFSYSGYDVLKPVKVTGEKFKGEDYRSNYNYGDFSTLDKIYKQSRSTQQLMSDVQKWPKEKQTIANMKEHFESHMQYSFSDKDIKKLMRSSKNEFYRPDHKNLKLKEVPHIEDFAAFYTYGNITRSNIFARVLGHKQSAVWATASHTSTPVTMITVGPKSLTQEFNGLLHSTEVGRKTIKALGLKKEYKTIIK